MSLPKPTIVLFDMDGTSVRHINPIFLHALEWLDDTAFKARKLLNKILPRKSYNLDVTDLAPRKIPKLLVHRAIHKVRRKPVEQIVEPCPGIYYVLELLKRHNIPMALASNGLGKGYGHDILEKFDLEKYFRATVFREDIKKSKPHPEPILLTLQKMNITLSADDVIWYIGDRHKDVIAVLAAQAHLPCLIVPIAYGFNAAVAVIEKNIGPDRILMSYLDIYTKLDTLLGPPPPVQNGPIESSTAHMSNKAASN
ncbi:MAG: HAD hydrolase-like protein [Alphaproteobacteria bacterium]